MSALSPLTANFTLDTKRYLRGRALLFSALAVPIAAHFMVPNDSASYAVLTINSMIPVRSASVLGLELGVLAATLMTPLAYIFLRAGPTRKRPWQITDVTPYSRITAAMGRWASDTGVLFIMLAALTIAGLILGVFRLEGDADIIKTIISLWLPAAPALALIAGLRRLLDARNLTRGWLGDVIFFTVWMTLMVVGIAGSENIETGWMDSRPMADAFGFTTPLIESLDGPVTAVTIGGATNTGQKIEIDAWRSLTSSAYLQSRVVWFAVAATLAGLAGMISAPIKPRQNKITSKMRKDGTFAPRIPISQIPFSAPVKVKGGTVNYFAVIVREMQLILKNKIWLTGLSIVAIMGAVYPFRIIAGPAILLAVIFPLTDASSRWQAKSTKQFLNTLGTNIFQRTTLLYMASVLLVAIILMPALGRMIVTGETEWLYHVGLITFVVPALIVATGAVTGSPVTGRMVMLIIWYIYLSSVTL